MKKLLDFLGGNGVVIMFAWIAFITGMAVEKLFPARPARSAVYEIPMGNNIPWRVTTFRGKVYVLIEAPSMPEEFIKGVK